MALLAGKPKSMENSIVFPRWPDFLLTWWPPSSSIPAGEMVSSLLQASCWPWPNAACNDWVQKFQRISVMAQAVGNKVDSTIYAWLLPANSIKVSLWSHDIVTFSIRVKLDTVNISTICFVWANYFELQSIFLGQSLVVPYTLSPFKFVVFCKSLRVKS